MDSESSRSLKGQLLMAMPGLADPNFYQTVTYMSEHTDQGAVGIVINRVHPMLKAKMIFDELGVDCTPNAGNMPVHIGGPVHVNEIFVLHGPPFNWEGTLVVDKEVALSNSLDVIKAAAQEEGPENLILALGCAGWGVGQLEGEIRENIWLTGPYSEEIVFHTAAERQWEGSMAAIGIDPALLSDEAGHA